jgi:hypothetical protein
MYRCYLLTRRANGCTTKLVPIMIRRSASGKSSVQHWKKVTGRFSPKNTMSGFTRPLNSTTKRGDDAAVSVLNAFSEGGAFHSLFKQAALLCIRQEIW